MATDREVAEFYTELADRNDALEAARAARQEDPARFEEIATEYAEWRRGIRRLAGRPEGPGASVTTEDGAA